MEPNFQVIDPQFYSSLALPKKLAKIDAYQVTSSLIIPKPDLVQDSANYQCVAVNVHGSSHSMVSRVNILQKPKINKNSIQIPVSANGKYQINTSIGQSVKLACQAEGSPKPDILWSKNQLENSRFRQNFTAGHEGRLEYNQFDQVNNAEIVISDLKLEDQGEYKCVAKNLAGMQHACTKS